MTPIVALLWVGVTTTLLSDLGVLGQRLKLRDQEGQMLKWEGDYEGQMLVKVVERHMLGCQLVLWTTVPHSPVVSAFLRQVGVGGVVVVDGGVSQLHQYFLQDLWNHDTITCRGLLLYSHNNNNNNNATNEALMNLELTGLWKKSGVRVFIASSSSSSSSSVKEVLLHPTLRNTIHAVYLVLEAGDSRVPRLPSLPRVGSRPAPPTRSRLFQPGTRVARPPRGRSQGVATKVPHPEGYVDQVRHGQLDSRLLHQEAGLPQPVLTSTDVSESSLLDFLRKGLRRKFSEDSVALMRKALRPTSRRQYQSCWKRFQIFLSSAGRPLSQDTVLPFLAWLSSTGNRAPATFTAHVSALADPLWFGADIHLEGRALTLLSRGIRASSTPGSRNTPRWSLHKVLASVETLTQSQGEDELPMSSLFLLALATGFRASQLAAITRHPNFTSFGEDDDYLTLAPSPSFLAKNERSDPPGPSPEGGPLTPASLPRASNQSLHRTRKTSGPQSPVL
ncbi:hypothetical protein Pmani_017301 [Petrolisthes manimaculis]|uniref:Uncharacterized protein n=1 Tax=Petrolisthes manimaculis TaxID=1843537 RepID=A0AAE1PQG0_9EUCA|nr:hypothetical protein Pmani_017301 [Petrolisthes manimaculis]